MISEASIKKILKMITDSVTDNILWQIGGSTNLYVQGIKLKVGDIDITTDPQGYLFFKSKFRKYISKEEYVSSKSMQSLICVIDGVEVEFAYYDDISKHMYDKIKEINWHGLDVNILPLFYAKKIL